MAEPSSWRLVGTGRAGGILVIGALLGFLAGGLSGCSKPDAPKSDPEPAKRFDPVPATPSASPSGAPPRVPARVKREVLVGGCLGRCDSPKQALDGFLRAALSGDLEATRPFLNTAVLEHNGEPYGERWAQQFLDRQLGERRTDIDNWLKGWLGWVDRLVDPADRERAPSGITVVEENQRRFIVDYRHPELNRDPNGPPDAPSWRLVLQPRGLEWLVTEIVDRRRP